MAGDWIKMRADLHTHPKVVRISSALKADRLRVVGGLHAVWCLFDAHSEDGSLSGYSTSAVDELIGFPGFADAMCGVKWLVVEADGLSLPEFDEHNGQSAKRRAMETQRKRREREEEAAETARNQSAPHADEKRTREEKRREERNTKGDELSPGFVRFWNAWPSHFRKEAKGKCFASWKKAKAEPLAEAIVAHVERLKKSPNWLKDGGQYIPAPLPYLNDRRWEGADDASNDDPYGLKKAINYGG